MLTLQWSTIYWSQIICVQFYLLSLFVWWAISVAVCLIVGIIKAPTEVTMRISISLESTLFAWWLTHLLLTTLVTWLVVTISLSSEVHFLCFLLSVWALVLMVQCKVQLYSVMHVHLTVCLYDNLYCQSLN